MPNTPHAASFDVQDHSLCLGLGKRGAQLGGRITGRTWHHSIFVTVSRAFEPFHRNATDEITFGQQMKVAVAQVLRRYSLAAMAASSEYIFLPSPISGKGCW